MPIFVWGVDDSLQVSYKEAPAIVLAWELVAVVAETNWGVSNVVVMEIRIAADYEGCFATRGYKLLAEFFEVEEIISFS